MTNSVPQPVANSIQRFSRFFRAYNVGISLIVAAVPVAIAVWDLLPIFANGKGRLTLIASVASYLLVGFIFQQRIGIGKLYFPQGSSSRAAYSLDIQKSRWFARSPLLLAILSLVSFQLYFTVITNAVERVAYDNTQFEGNPASPERVCDTLSATGKLNLQISAKFFAYGLGAPVTIRCEHEKIKDLPPTVKDFRVSFSGQDVVTHILRTTPMTAIPYATLTATIFLSGFLCATSAFILMGLREYLQERLEIDDVHLINDRSSQTRSRRFDINGVPGMDGTVEYSPTDSTLPPKIAGPLCVAHDLRPEPAETTPDGTVSKWVHKITKDKETFHVKCDLHTSLTSARIESLLEESALLAITKPGAHAPRGDEARNDGP